MVRIKDQITNRTSVLQAARRAKRSQFSELIRRDMADADRQKTTSLDSYQRLYSGLLMGTGGGFILGTFGAAALTMATGIDLLAVSLLPSAASFVLLTQSEKLVYLNRLRRGKVRTLGGMMDFGELRAETTQKETH